MVYYKTIIQKYKIHSIVTYIVTIKSSVFLVLTLELPLKQTNLADSNYSYLY